MRHHYPDLARSSLRRTVQNWLVTHHQYRISALVPQMPFRREISGVVAKCRLLCQAATLHLVDILLIIMVSWHDMCHLRLAHGGSCTYLYRFKPDCHELKYDLSHQKESKPSVVQQPMMMALKALVVFKVSDKLN